MKMFRWLLCHLLSITLLLSCVFLFLSRDALREDFNRLTGKTIPVAAGDAGSSITNTEKDRLQSQAAEKNMRPVVNQSENSTEAIESTVKSEVTELVAVESQTVEPQTVEPQTVEPETVEPQTVEPQTVEPSTVTPAMSDNQSDAVSAEAPQAESSAKPEKLNNDPWDTVLQGVNDNKLPMSEFGSDMQTKQAVEPTAEAGFPPDNYDPEFSSTDTTDKTGSAGGSDIYHNTATGNQPVEQSYGAQQSLQDQTSSQGLESPRGVMGVDKLEDKTKYFAALEKARRLHWDGNTVPAQAEFERLMFEYPAMPEAAADLGNLLLQQGNREGAIWAYQNAIPRYLNLHREQEAINLTRFVSQYDPAIAESLQKKYW
ncbi:hypothetical protein N9100_02605 [Gammaproteobacteria bacterium]|nr:hypothetical protein [Gammaproteobacteria bacterium]